ncbi:acetolactate synthase [Candidatus Roizmanbacteria bacterium CG_4_9_14_0_8_um_filter_34_12]|uniref:Acetolactate synthase n=1 Tax=Candidatus Roizmanbacteria bacterium CG_4_9_14_0_8_um_filter_34_12 TaxID=1974840 RepID=A0A2M8DD05_9BACT|nr:MAG: acetolactate synthase [Candidatus Roizmanbacteria bacterium CG_4_9_14_0_8_um_filter_34_12]
MRVADYIIDFLYKNNATHIFTIAGGGAMFLNDATVSHKKIRYICHHHEQAAAMAAEAFTKTSGKLGAVMVTSGPGSTNAITGLLEAWQNSIPCIFISSQAKTSQMAYFSNVPKLRQFGIQELNIIPIVQSLCKYSAIIEKPEDIRYQMEKAYDIAISKRPGPVWLDIPPDIASKTINPSQLSGHEKKQIIIKSNKEIDSQIDQLIKLLQLSKKPVIIAGGGIRLAGAVNEFIKFTNMLKIPVVVPEMGLDLLEFDNPYYVGHGGTKGQRSANIVLQNSDLIIAIGSRLAVPFIGHEYDKFAPNAKKIVVDIDKMEHLKKTIKIDLFIESNAKQFINKFSDRIISQQVKLNYNHWLSNCQKIKEKYAIYLPKIQSKLDFINMYHLVSEISNQSKEGDIYTFDAGTTAYICSQTIKIKKDQRAIIPGATLTMGYNLPAVIGIWAAKPKSRIICITGDGSFQMNIHELQTIVHHKIPAKIFVINNQGYLAIRTTQRNFFQSRFIGEGKNSGVSFPNTEKIAKAYGIKYFQIKNNGQLKTKVKAVLDYKNTCICEVLCPKWQDILTVSSKKMPDGKMISLPIDDMFPFLPEKEMAEIKQLLK